MKNKEYSLHYFNEFGEEHYVEFRPYEYYSLMELLFDKYIEEWGDCKGKAWCGTCHIQIIEGCISEKMDSDEEDTLSKLANVTRKSRLACQIPVTSNLDGIIFKILKDDGI